MHNEPNILLIDNQFLSPQEVALYQSLLPGNWTPSPSPQDIKYFSKDLYRHYKWDHDWDSVGWLDSTPPAWEDLYHKIALLLPPHYVHWVDLKITPPLSTGTPLHRDRDPSSSGGDPQRFSKAISVICNLNQQWDPVWGGDFILWAENSNNLQEHTRIPISPGQLVIVENCYHSIAPIVEYNQSRISFILHVLQYQ